MQPRVNVLLLIGILLICSVAVEASPYTGVISVDTVQVSAGTSCAVTVRIANNNAVISGVRVPLKFQSSALTLDSVSFAGSLLTDGFQGVYAYDAANKTVEVVYVPDMSQPSIIAASGVLARLFFKVSAQATPGLILIDSINIDTVIEGLRHTFQIEISDNTGTILTASYVRGAVKVLVPTAVDDTQSSLPARFALGQNYPNPFNPSTKIDFSLPSAGAAKLEVFNVLGQVVSTALDRRMEAGQHQVEFNGTALPSGIYFYRLATPFGTQTRKMVLLK